MPASDCRTNRGAIARGAVMLIAVIILARTLAQVDWRGASTLLANAGPKAYLALLPFAVIMGIDAGVQRMLFGRLRVHVGYKRLYLVRLVTEALTMSLPAGVVVAETSGPLLIERRCGVSVDRTIVVNATKRWLTIRAHSFYLALSAVLGFGVWERAFTTPLAVRTVAVLVVGASLGLFAASIGIGAIFRGRQWPARAVMRLRTLPLARLRVWLDSKEQAIAAIDEKLGHLGEARSTQTWACAALLGAWVLESVETWLILRLLGAPIEFTEVIAFEAALSLVRSAAFFVPAGLGFQDFGYVTFLAALGLPGAGALGAAFVVIKRAKEIVWILVGGAIGGLLVTSRTPAIRTMHLPDEAMS